MSKLDLRPLTLDDLDKIYKYTSVFGENSCQHSPVSLFSTFEKYGDEFLLSEDTLFIHRSRLDDETHRAYLAPLGENAAAGFQRISDDCAAYGKKVRYVTLTEQAAGILGRVFEGEYEIKENRDLAEYIYSTEKLATYSGSDFQKRRWEVSRFYKKYGGRFEVRRITPDDYEDILDFEQKWLAENCSPEDEDDLQKEGRMVSLQIRNYEKLNLDGIVLRVDDEIGGFAYGTKLNDDCVDGIIEKADRHLLQAYKVLTQEFAKLFCSECRLLNMEEDIGIPGIRSMKLNYKPLYILRKFTARQL